MTVTFFSGKGRRAGVALGAVSAGLLLLSACEKPTPLATVTVGTASVHTEAACYNNGEAIKTSEIQSCLNKTAEKSIEVHADDKVRFGVDPEIAKNGWTIFIGGQQAEQQPYKLTYRTIPGSAFFVGGQLGQPAPDKVQVSIVETNGTKLTGVWHFELKKATD
ncbi:DUF2771 domain-containing protein [Streptomyces sannanensis]|uniref:DUF2771 domain-containing protein n=1 Tax=Streptomyces sannanensis TaxID=285536 RepID=A0ABP6SBH1_9ACTN